MSKRFSRVFLGEHFISANRALLSTQRWLRLHPVYKILSRRNENGRYRSSLFEAILDSMLSFFDIYEARECSSRTLCNATWSWARMLSREARRETRDSRPPSLSVTAPRRALSCRTSRNALCRVASRGVVSFCCRAVCYSWRCRSAFRVIFIRQKCMRLVCAASVARVSSKEAGDQIYRVNRQLLIVSRTINLHDCFNNTWKSITPRKVSRDNLIVHQSWVTTGKRTIVAGIKITIMITMILRICTKYLIKDIVVIR